MSVTKLPSHTTVADGQFVQVAGPNAITTGYSYDEQQRAFYFKESQVVYPSRHGISHIAEDPIPNATCDTPGLLSADDKCKLDALIQSRIGVLGYQGAGFPDDGGWMQGDTIIAAGTEFISIERIGNVIRFTVDSPIPLNCACEECSQIFWVQDETDIAAIRPPTCGGKLPGTNSYGELKVYLFPESTIVDPNNPATTLNSKGNFPSFIFKRYDDTIIPGAAEHEMVLKRDSINTLQTEIGWAFTPGATAEIECIWFTGKDNNGNQTRFEIKPSVETNGLGALLYKGHLISKKMAVITDYTNTIITTNIYQLREWNPDGAVVVGASFTAKNIWQYLNPENAASGNNPKTQVLDASIDLLPIGTLVDVWWFKVGEVAGEPIRRYYFSQKPTINPNHIWTWMGQAQFGDVDIARQELQANAGSEDAISSVQVSSIRQFEKTQWGLTGFDDPLVDFDTSKTSFTFGTENADLSYEHRAIIDTQLPGLKVVAATESVTDFSERPVYLWNRKSLCNAILRLDVGRPSSSAFTPYDILIRAPIDESTTKYLRVVGKGSLADGTHYIRLCGAHFQDLPAFGSFRTLSPINNHNIIYNYNRKLMFSTSLNEGTGENLTAPSTMPPVSMTEYCGDIILIETQENVPYTGDVGDIVELLHQEYSTNIVRVEFSFNEVTSLVEAQFKVGYLDMTLPYEDGLNDDVDDYVRGLAPGYAVSGIYSQAGIYTGVGTAPNAAPEGFICYEGGEQIGGEKSEYWNKLEIMVRNNQVWLWWNNLLVPPNTQLSANLPTPVSITTPYFPIEYNEYRSFGKYGVRLWPGSLLRRIDLRTQITTFSEFTYGQLDITS